LHAADHALRDGRGLHRGARRAPHPEHRVSAAGSDLPRPTVRRDARLDAAAAAGDELAIRRGGVSRGSGGGDALDRVGRWGCDDARLRAPRRAGHGPPSRSTCRRAHAPARSAAPVPVTLGWRVPGPALGAAAPVRPGVATALVTPALNPIVRWAFALLVFSIPFEFPERSFPVEIPTITAAIFLLATPLQLRACYA